MITSRCLTNRLSISDRCVAVSIGPPYTESQAGCPSVRRPSVRRRSQSRNAGCPSSIADCWRGRTLQSRAPSISQPGTERTGVAGGPKRIRRRTTYDDDVANNGPTHPADRHRTAAEYKARAELFLVISLLRHLHSSAGLVQESNLSQCVVATIVGDLICAGREQSSRTTSLKLSAPN